MFSKVKNAPAHVFFLHFEDNDDKYFFWIQEPDTNNRYNDIIENTKTIIAFDPEEMEEEVPLQQQEQGKMEEEKVQEELQDKVETPKKEETPLPQPTIAERRDSLTQDFMKALERMASTQYSQGKKWSSKTIAPSLSTVFTADYLKKISEEEEFKAALSEHLPENQELTENLISPQFRQSLDTIENVFSLEINSKALRSEDGANIYTSLGFDQAMLMQTVDRLENF